MTFDLNSLHGLALRATNCPESVALFTDAQLIDLARKSDDKGILSHLLGEMLVRTWLYRCKTAEMQESLDTLTRHLCAEALVGRFTTAVNPLRARPWPVEPQSIEAAFAIGKLSEELERIWSFALRRVRAFLACDGIIPATIANGGVAIPFAIGRNHKRGQIFDTDGRSIEGWVGEAQELWNTLGRRFAVRLGCAFGDHAVFRNGKPLVSGGSFALPLLFAATRSKDEDTHPLNVICTGSVLNDQLREIDGRDQKQDLAKRIGAELFVAPGMGEPWFLSPDMEIKAAIAAIWKKLGKADQEIQANIANAFAKPEGEPFAHDIEELTANFVGREEEIRSAIEWIQSTQAQGGSITPLWIGGEAGCGKSAFLAEMTRKCAAIEGWFPVPYFFGKTEDRTQEDFFRSATMQLARGFEIDLDHVRHEDPEEQFRVALANITPASATRVIFLIDGLNEANGPLNKLIEVAREVSGCVWVLSGQDTHETSAIRDAARNFPKNGLGRLRDGAMRALIRAEAPEMPDELVKAIVDKARGLPLYTRVVLGQWKTPGATLDPADLPDKVQDYYEELIEGITRQRHRRESRWRGMLLDVFAVLATAREHSLSAATVTYMLSRILRRCSEADVLEALGACDAVLEKIRSSNDPEHEPLRWRFRHDSLRQFLLRDDSMKDALDSARAAWAEVCRGWDSAELEAGARAYALRFLVLELTQAGEHDAIIELAKNPRFLDAQTFTLGTRFALHTLACGVEVALREQSLADASALTLARARRAERAYAESPLTAVRNGHHWWALELIKRIENQNDRTLWHLALAAWHVNGKRMNLAAKILDNAIPPAALREKLSGGASLCAAVLLSLLTDVWTQRFQWGRFLSRLDDESKRDIVPLLVNAQRLRLTAAWQMLGSIENAKLRDNARQDVVRELASFNTVLAERQLARFDSELSRAWAAVEVVAAYVARQQWADADRVIDCFIPDRSAQLAKALAYKASGLRRSGFTSEAARDCLASLRIIRKGFPNGPAQQAKSYAEFAQVQTDAGFVQHATFDYALKTASSLTDTHIVRGMCFTALVNSIAPAVRQGALLSQLHEAVAYAQRELASTDDDKADGTRLRLMRALARSGHFDLAREVLNSITDETMHSAAAGRLCAYLLRFDRNSPRELYRKARRSDDGMLFHGLIALEKANKNPSSALSEICQSLPVTKSRMSTPHWGTARILCEAGVVLSLNKDERAVRIFEAGRASLDHISQEYRGRHLVNLASLRAESGDSAAARDLLAQARTCSPGNEDDEIALLAEIESAEVRYHLATSSGLPVDGVFQRVEGMANDDLVHKLDLFCQLVSPFAAANRCRDLDDVCRFAFSRLEDSRFLLKRDKRSQLAARFAGKLSKSALNLNGFRQWTARFVGVCRQLEAEYQTKIPAEALRAEALMRVAEGEFDEAVAAAQTIEDGETRSVVFRDLAIRAVREGHCERALHLCTRITHGRSQHLPDIGRELVERNVTTDAPHLHQLMALCSEYSDAAYRIVSSLIRFHKPEPDALLALLRACGLWREALPSHAETSDSPSQLTSGLSNSTN